ncbi:reverse transcriptase domain-containing protein [Clostridium tyrobutyricum]|jgi:retron-type reverse transcriptase|uniref:reverse transcriptase domain-containing protein n=1 Tax=Clostridium tyrobutyricum TaxID=1519 RepID=UPI0002ECC938|nr:reverse transcriptase domain-containing protein [Clostridium tyrobutyricum]MEA5009690.1 reverse transcriptase domain-containing protein [Clostridium tyrobutyricum]
MKYFENKSKQYNDFLEYNNFILAYKRLQTAGRNLYKTLYMNDLKIFGIYLEKNIQSLIYKIKEGSYNYGKALKYYLPKNNGRIRPITICSITDLIIYQALVNIISKATANEFKNYYNKFIYGNILNEIDTKDSIFFFKPWKKQWKIYSQLHDKFFNEGYVYLCEFDIASFFDTINHNILKGMLLDYKVSSDLVETLIELLLYMSKDSSRGIYYSSSGIPQGPIASSYLADLYLHYIDKKLINYTLGKKSNMKYIRYVDDIKIYTTNEPERDKNIVQLDLLSRDIGLIPQNSKILKRKMDNPEREIREQFRQFSQWANEYKKGNYVLRKSTHKKLKKKLLKKTKIENGSFEVDKTILSYSMYKLNKDDEIKKYIFNNFKFLYSNIEPVLFYLSRYYKDDYFVKLKIKDYLLEYNFVFDYIYALIFKYFKNIDYDRKIFKLHYNEENQYWLKRYYMLDWLYENKKYDLIKSLTDNIEIVNRKINYFKSQIVTDYDTKVLNMKRLMRSSNIVDALSSTYYYNNEFIMEYMLKKTNEKRFNEFVENILSEKKIDFINTFFRNECSIYNSNCLFNENIFKPKSYIEMKKSWIIFCNYRKIDPSVAFMNINIFNHILIIELNRFFNEKIKSKDYGTILNEIKWPSNLLTLRDTFININDLRNQRTYSHPFDKNGEIRSKIKFNELEYFVKKELKSLDELIIYFEKLDINNYNCYQKAII